MVTSHENITPCVGEAAITLYLWQCMLLLIKNKGIKYSELSCRKKLFKRLKNLNLKSNVIHINIQCKNVLDNGDDYR